MSKNSPERMVKIFTTIPESVYKRCARMAIDLSLTHTDVYRMAIMYTMRPGVTTDVIRSYALEILGGVDDHV